MGEAGFLIFCLIATANLASGADADTDALNIFHVGNETLGDYKISDLLTHSESVDFFLFTRKNPTQYQVLYLNNTASITNSNFNPNNPTRFTIHGWMSDASQEINVLIRDAYLSEGEYNVIAVNWVKKSVNVYEVAVYHVPGVALIVAQFIDFMVKNGFINLENVLLAGHSLGAHVAGIAARSLQTGRANIVVGLDPAQLHFPYNTSKVRLRSTDASYVETIQTCAGSLGYVDPVGKASFYPNGGVYQPGCILDLLGTCCHFRSYMYFAEAIRIGGFNSIKCNNSSDAIHAKCGKQISTTVRMGAEENALVAEGVFYVPVGYKSPYSQV